MNPNTHNSQVLPDPEVWEDYYLIFSQSFIYLFIYEGISELNELLIWPAPCSVMLRVSGKPDAALAMSLTESTSQEFTRCAGMQ